MVLAARKLKTYQDYLAIPKSESDARFELIDGDIVAMVGAGRRHQRIVGELATQLRTQLRGRRCESFIAPFDVRLPRPNQSANDATSAVQPDLLVYCDPSHHDESGGLCAPDFVIEVLSPGSGGHDHVRKLALYDLSGVVEYWIVDPANQLVLKYLREDGRLMHPQSFNFDCVAAVEAVPELTLDLAALMPLVVD